MSVKIALAGNPNCGKTTMFNDLTRSNQYVGNWPGVTVEKKEGKLRWDKNITITDLPGIYSLSPYSLEEVVTRNYIINEKPDVILNLIDASNIERNLYLTTQLLEMGIPVVIALNMIDVVRKRGDKIDIKKLEEELKCKVIETSAVKGEGLKEAVKAATTLADKSSVQETEKRFDKETEKSISEIKEIISKKVDNTQIRWYCVKLFERDEKVLENISLTPDEKNKIEEIIKRCEKSKEDDSESIITNERYNYIADVVKKSVNKKSKSIITVSDKIDRIVTNKFLAIPIFAFVMFLVYFISVSSLGTIFTDWANNGVFGDGWHLFAIGSSDYENAVESGLDEVNPADYGVWIPGIPVLVENGLDNLGVETEWLRGLILDGIIGGVGSVLGFLPQMLILFFLLSLLEDCGYMSRIAFIMDRVFRKFGLSGKSFIPMLIGTGCGVPGIMASRTIENEKDRKMTIMTTTFIPCGAKLPIIALIAGALFNEAFWVGPVAYFIGIAAIIISGMFLKRTILYQTEATPFVMELPAYHIPAPKSVFIHTWERGKSFVKKAGTVIFVACGIIWFAQSFDWSLNMVDASDSILASIGSVIAPIFKPLGFGDWKAAVATITGLVAKENVVGTFGVLYGMEEIAENGSEIWVNMRNAFTQVSAFSFLTFNLLCAPCFAAIGAIKREMGNWKWTFITITYQTLFAYIVSLLINLFGNAIFLGESFIPAICALIVIIAIVVSMLTFSKNNEKVFSKKAAAFNK